MSIPSKSPTERTMTIAEAAAAGLLPGTKARGKTKRTRQAAPRSGATRCFTHDETFATTAAEDRHVAAHHGCRIEMVT